MTNRYSRTGTALADGISGTRVMQPANNAVIQAPALPRLFRSNCSADKKAPLEIRRPFLPEPFMRPQAFQPEKTNREASNAAVHSRKQAPQEKSVPPPFGQGPAYGFMEQEDLEACKAELSISTASQNTPTAIRPKTQAPATERMFIASFRRSASSQHRRTSTRSAPQTEPGQMPHFSSREGCLLGYRSDLIITGCGNGSGCITERSKGMYFIAPF